MLTFSVFLIDSEASYIIFATVMKVSHTYDLPNNNKYKPHGKCKFYEKYYIFIFGNLYFIISLSVLRS